MRFYDCLGENDWEADLDMLDSLCDERTGAIMVVRFLPMREVPNADPEQTNPSNPCGSNYSQDHLEAILAVAEKRKIPIIADEIYGHMVS